KNLIDSGMKPKPWHQRGEGFGVHGLAARPSPVDVERYRHGAFRPSIPDELIFEARPEIVEALRASLRGNVEVDPCLLEGHAEILGDRLGILAGNVELPRGRIVTVLKSGDRRQRQLVGDARIVDI